MVMDVPRKKRDEVRTNFRLDPEVKKRITETADEDGRSENMQAEYLLRLGLEYRLIKKSVS